MNQLAKNVELNMEIEKEYEKKINIDKTPLKIDDQMHVAANDQADWIARSGA